VRRIFTGEKCHCKRGIERDNCPHCEGTGKAIDFRAMRYESTADFKARLAIAERKRRGEGDVSVLGASLPSAYVTRKTEVQP